MHIMGYMQMFNKVTKARLKDCFVDGNSLLTFVVETNEIGKAIGKKAMNVKVLEKRLNRKIKIMEFNADIKKFIKNLIYPLQINDIKVEEGVITLEPRDKTTRGYLIGRAASNLRNYEETAKRYFNDVKEIKVI